ncbi:MAG: L,D-transpeptidase family protein [Bacteroidales bacterium]|nr:L,D-transpeptidase family protein [Bacteroidales bacterium]MCF8457570.1 L,D-transpeptidase family protein [Bacteroidales bacterium]
MIKKIFGSLFSNNETSDSNTSEPENKKNMSWFERIKQFNGKVEHLVVFNSKLLIFIMLLFFVYLLFASVFQPETFSINEINVHSSLKEKGYNSTFIAKKISYHITNIVNEVPEKLTAMFSSGEREKNEILYNKILEKYTKKEIKIDMDVDVGGINLPLKDLTKTARSLFDVEDKSLDGDLTVEKDLVVMTLGFNSNGINQSYKSVKYDLQDSDTTKLFDVIGKLTNESAKFVLAQYDPLVTLLIDFNPNKVYSSRNLTWKEEIYTEDQRLQILKDMCLDENKDHEIAVWAYAITGAIYSEKFNHLKKLVPKYNMLAIQNYQKAIEMDPSFIDIVGIDLANSYFNLNDPQSIQNVIMTYKQMIKSNPKNLKVHQKLLAIYSDQKDEQAYSLALEDAFRNGLYIPENKKNRSQYERYKEKERMNTKHTDAVEAETMQKGSFPKLFEEILKMNNSRIGVSEQILLVTNEYISSKDAILQTFEKTNDQWVEKFAKTSVTIGRSGFAPYRKKREGDGKTPTGIFYLGPVYSYPGEKVNTKMEYWEASENDYWIDDVQSDQYNRWVISPTDPKSDKVSREVMKRNDILYKYGIAIHYNMDQQKGKGSVIVVHVLEAEKPTAGCIAVPEEDLLDIIGWLDPVKKPLIIMGNLEELITQTISEPELNENDKYNWKKEKYKP